MRYWDASALVPIIVNEALTARARSWLDTDPYIATWAWSHVEIVAAIERRAREGLLSPAQRRESLERFAALADAWDEVTDVSAVRVRAIPLLARHALRAADAAQLGAALVVSHPEPAGIPFVCFDARLAAAAEREGFRVLSTP